MGTVESDLLCAFEVHSVGEIRAILDGGFDLRAPINGKSVVNALTEMYTRSDRFPDCLRLLLARGAVLDDPRVGHVLLDDADGLRAALRQDPSLLEHRTTMVSAFTPLAGASLLHVAAEFGNLAVARVLVEMGADVDAAAAVDEHGLNGHTPLFHTVNSNANRSAELMRLLLDAGARVDVRLPGITWGKGMEWETTLFDVTPISYAQFGLLPQVHREERDIYNNIRLMLEACGRRVPPLSNVPNRYLHPEEAVSPDTLKAITAAFNAHDLDAIMEFFAEDCTLEMPRGPEPWGQRFTGKAAVREGLSARFKGLPDVHYGDDRHWVYGNVGVSEWLLTGTAPDGRPVRVRGCDHWEFRDGKVTRKDSYWKIVER